MSWAVATLAATAAIRGSSRDDLASAVAPEDGVVKVSGAGSVGLLDGSRNFPISLVRITRLMRVTKAVPTPVRVSTTALDTSKSTNVVLSSRGVSFEFAPDYTTSG